MQLNLNETQVQDVVNAARVRTDELEYHKSAAESRVAQLVNKVAHLETDVSKMRTEVWETSVNTENRVRASAQLPVRMLLGAMQGKRKIEAIKAVRDLTHMGLKEAKDLVEEFDPIHNRTQYKIYVEISAQEVKPPRHVVSVWRDGVEVVYRPCKNHKEADSIANGMILALLADPKNSVNSYHCAPGKEHNLF